MPVTCALTVDRRELLYLRSFVLIVLLWSNTGFVYVVFSLYRTLARPNVRPRRRDVIQLYVNCLILLNKTQPFVWLFGTDRIQFNFWARCCYVYSQWATTTTIRTYVSLNISLCTAFLIVVFPQRRFCSIHSIHLNKHNVSRVVNGKMWRWS